MTQHPKRRRNTKEKNIRKKKKPSKKKWKGNKTMRIFRNIIKDIRNLYKNKIFSKYIEW